MARPSRSAKRRDVGSPKPGARNAGTRGLTAFVNAMAAGVAQSTASADSIPQASSDGRRRAMAPAGPLSRPGHQRSR